ncbi:hexokinase type 2 [Stomoxys calcitrans]|uniref:hexokinase type 2 n=1 Tax=Stomoxys calcitrans TaxID=35570 RepID=UPI0027E35747|nr:hexokinase type 2 [Stomoxys calcitrans]
MHDERLKDFLKPLVLTDSQLNEVYKRFCNEISKGLDKNTHSQADTKCFVTYVQDLPTGDEVGKYLALDLGGTNFRVLLVTLKGHHEAVVESEIYAVPKEVMLGTGVQLFDHIAQCLATFVESHKVGAEYLPLGFTFSFPCVQLGLTKALLVRWTKGFQCAGVEQEDVGRLLKEAIVRHGGLEIHVMAILNDTTGTLMSCAHRNPECRVGVIIGTGCNACYVERVEDVDQLEEELKTNKKYVLINTEWGAFGDSGTLDFVRTEYDKVIDRNSLNVGTQLFEKMISGMYLGELVQHLLIDALKKNLIFVLSQNKNEYIQKLSSNACFETSMISDIEADKFPECRKTRGVIKQLFGVEKASVEDCQKLQYICECVSRRAAYLVAVALSGLINRINERKVVVGVDGSVYRCHPKFDAYMRETMQKLVRSNVNFDLMLSEDGSGRGAALVAAVASRDNKLFCK